jgi:hypothetical protein
MSAIAKLVVQKSNSSNGCRKTLVQKSGSKSNSC